MVWGKSVLLLPQYSDHMSKVEFVPKNELEV